jgi:putative transposase
VLLTPRTADAPSRLMKDVGQRFSQYMNKKYSRRGAFWE